MNMSRTEMNFTFAATADSASSQQAPTINRVLTANELQDIVDEQHHQNNTDEATRPKILHLLLGTFYVIIIAFITRIRF